MNAALLIYLASVSGSLLAISSIFIGACMIYIVGCFLGYMMANDFMGYDKKLAEGSGERLTTRLKLASKLMALPVIIVIFLPSQNTILTMAGAKVAQDIIESPETKEIGSKILKVINSKLDEAGKGGRE